VDFFAGRARMQKNIFVFCLGLERLKTKEDPANTVFSAPVGKGGGRFFRAGKGCFLPEKKEQPKVFRTVFFALPN